MSLICNKKEIEAERLVGYRFVQMLSRAETLVSGAGREPIEPLLWDANAVIIRTDVQNDRVVLDGTLNCQAVYRQGEENTLRALSAKSAITQAIDVANARPGMLCRVDVQVEHAEARYENGHMVFQVGLGIKVWVITLEKIEGIESIEDDKKLETKFADMQFVKLAAEAGETAVMTASVEVPHSLDARNTLMDWGTVLIDSVQPDLGGIRIKGRAMIETLVSSGIEGHPAVVIKYPMEIDKLIEIPEWLAQDANVSAQIRNIRTEIENDKDGEEEKLQIQADVHFSIASNIKENVRLLADAYGLGNTNIELDAVDVGANGEVSITRNLETIRGTVVTDEGSSAVGNIIAVRVQPNLAEALGEGGRGRISGLIEADVLYMPAGGERPESTHTELPFEMEISQPLREDSIIQLSVISTEANALMSDRLEMKIALCADCETRIPHEYTIAQNIEIAGENKKKSAYIICWPADGDDAWSIGKRYGIAESAVQNSAGEIGVQTGKCFVLSV